MTLRLSAEQADELEAVARAEGISVSDAVREAIA
ncbi:MAG: ribbon-helix-helix protein, CopG family, partial [Solirubrobacterales bacterium]